MESHKGHDDTRRMSYGRRLRDYTGTFHGLQAYDVGGYSLRHGRSRYEVVLLTENQMDSENPIGCCFLSHALIAGERACIFLNQP